MMKWYPSPVMSIALKNSEPCNSKVWLKHAIAPVVILKVAIVALLFLLCIGTCKNKKSSILGPAACKWSHMCNYGADITLVSTP